MTVTQAKTSSLGSTVHTYRETIPDPGEPSADIWYDPTDPTHCFVRDAAYNAASQNGPFSFKATYNATANNNAATNVFNANVSEWKGRQRRGCRGQPDGQLHAQDHGRANLESSMIDIEKLYSLLGKFPECEDVEIPGYGSAKVKVLTQAEKDKFDLALETKSDRVGFRARLIVASVIDERGALVFDEDAIPKLMGLPAYVLEPIVDVALRINRLSKQDQDALAKNSNGQPVSS